MEINLIQDKIRDKIHGEIHGGIYDIIIIQVLWSSLLYYSIKYPFYHKLKFHFYNFDYDFVINPNYLLVPIICIKSLQTINKYKI